jgi:hypothetical protein
LKPGEKNVHFIHKMNVYIYRRTMSAYTTKRWLARFISNNGSEYNQSIWTKKDQFATNSQWGWYYPAESHANYVQSA